MTYNVFGGTLNLAQSVIPHTLPDLCSLLWQKAFFVVKGSIDRHICN